MMMQFSGQSFAHKEQPMQAVKLVTGFSVRQEPVLFFKLLLASVIKFIFLLLFFLSMVVKS